MKILEKLPKYTRVPRIARTLDPTIEEFEALIARFPLKIVRALKSVFENGTPISQAAKENRTTTQLVRYYLNKMHLMKNGEKYNVK